MTGLSDRAVLEIDIVDSEGTKRTCIFELQEDLEIAPATTASYLIGNRGAVLREAVSIGSDLLGVEGIPQADRRRGYYVDGGGGVANITISATGGDRNKQWGDGSSDPDDADSITKYDATGCDPQTQVDILDYVISQSKGDSASSGARIYYGQWTDGTHAATAGVYGKPRVLAIQEVSFQNPSDDPSAFSVTIEANWAAVFPAASVDEAQDAVEELLEASSK